MLKLFDTKCTECNQIIEQYTENNKDLNPCPVCGAEMEKIFSKMNFKLLYDPKKDLVSWGNEGYSESQYWKEVKRLREEGHDVKGANEE